MYARYEPRPLAFLRLETVSGFRLKCYSICYGDQPHDPERFRAAWERAAAELPQPAAAPARPGVGFAILHQGRTADYFILAWWDQENELPLRVFVNGANGWRAAAGGESVCVWDLHVIAREREAYVGTVLAGRVNGIEEYLAIVEEGWA